MPKWTISFFFFFGKSAPYQMYFLSEALHQNNSQPKWHLRQHCISRPALKGPFFFFLSAFSVFQGHWQGNPSPARLGSQDVSAVMHRASDCIWAPIQTTCHEKIFTPQFRHYSHTTMPLVDRRPSWAERRVVLFTSSILEGRDRQWRGGGGSENIVVIWREAVQAKMENMSQMSKQTDRWRTVEEDKMKLERKSVWPSCLSAVMIYDDIYIQSNCRLLGTWQ